MIKKSILVLFSVLFALFLSGCVNTNKVPFIEKGYTDFNLLTKELVEQMHDDIVRVTPKSKNLIYVTDFVNIRNLKTTSQLGFFLSSEVKSNITEHFNLNIKEIEYSKYLKIDNSGTQILSRDSRDLRFASVDKTYILVGTYAITSKQLLVYLKLIDMKTGNLIKSASNSIFINKEILELEESRPNIQLRPRMVL